MYYSKLIIDLNAIKNNLINIRKKQKKDCKIIAMVKANAYGLGMIEVSKYIEKEKLAEYLGVAYLEEAINLTKNNIKLPIIVTRARINR